MRLLALFPLIAAVTLCAGEKAAALHCGSCHREQATAQPHTDMAQALSSGAGSEILKSHAKLTFREGDYTYTIERDGQTSWYDIASTNGHVRLPIAWAFGLGAAGQTYVFEYKGALYQSRVSYYKDIDALDITVGAPREKPRTLEDALGQEQSARAAGECFNCHATAAIAGGALHTEALKPGVTCDRCHQNSTQHMASFEQASAPKVFPPKLQALRTEEMSDFCGQCHRTWAEIAINGPHDVNNVRFQPYRLTNSKCYDTADSRIRCTSCHDPHQQLVTASSFYDSRCNSCHGANQRASVKTCRIAKKDCTTCHMPKISVPGTHHRFTDHWIRVVRTGERYPS